MFHLRKLQSKQGYPTLPKRNPLIKKKSIQLTSHYLDIKWMKSNATKNLLWELSYVDKKQAPNHRCLHQVVHLCRHRYHHNIRWLSCNKLHLMKMSYYIFLLQNLVHNDFPNSRVPIRLGKLINNFSIILRNQIKTEFGMRWIGMKNSPIIGLEHSWSVAPPVKPSHSFATFPSFLQHKPSVPHQSQRPACWLQLVRQGWPRFLNGSSVKYVDSILYG